jgi:predicted DNA-binding transcriptional regulator AlpA
MNNERLIVTLTVIELKELVSKSIAAELSKNQISSVENNNSVDTEILLTRFEVAALFKVSTVTLDKWKKAGLLPNSIKLAAKVYYLKKEILDMIKAKKK